VFVFSIQQESKGTRAPEENQLKNTEVSWTGQGQYKHRDD
jgi:hypothetical protein